MTDKTFGQRPGLLRTMVAASLATGLALGVAGLTPSPASASIKPTPTLSVSASPSLVTLGTSTVTLSASAMISGGLNPTGAIQFALYDNGSLVDTESVTVAGNGAYVTPTGYTLPTSGTVTGSYQWNIAYSGDRNNTGATDVNDPAGSVTVNTASPSLTSSADPTTATSSTEMTDDAVLSGGYQPTGTITFTLTSGSIMYDEDIVTVAGNGTYSPTSVSGLPSNTYQWHASYSGDGNNNGATDQGGSGESVTIATASPSLSGTPEPASATVGGGTPPTLKDSEVLSGGSNPAGVLVFYLYNPDGQQVDMEQVTVSGNGTYTTPTGYTLPSTGALTGTYLWRIFYSGDESNHGTSDQQSATVTQIASPSVTGQPNETALTLGPGSSTLTDSALLSGGNNPTGTLTFTLMDGTTVVDTENVAVDGNGSYSTPNGYTLPLYSTVTVTYQWDVSYSGDSNNNPASDTDDPDQQVVVSAASPSLSATASPRQVDLAGGADTLQDSAFLSGGYNPTGTLTFTLEYGTTVVDTENVAVYGNGSYSTPTGYTLPTTGPVAGSYQWNVSYSGDGNNNAATDTDDPLGQVTVSPASPSLTTNNVPRTIGLDGPSPTLDDSDSISGGYHPTGTLTFTLVEGRTVVDTEIVTVDGNGSYNTPTGYTLPTTGAVTGFYQWNVSYSGDDNNNPASDNDNSLELFAVDAASPSLTVSESPTAVSLTGAPVTLHDSALISDGYYPTGTLTFTLQQGTTVVDTETVNVTGNGNYDTPVGYTLPTTGTVTGTYQWAVSYSGDDNNNSYADTGDPTQQVTVSDGPPAQLVVLEAPPTATAGVAFPVQIGVEDGNGDLLTSDNTDQVALAASGAAGACGATPVTVAAGVATFTCSLRTEGTSTLTATDASLAPTTTTVAVKAAAARKLVIVAGPPPSLVPDTSFNVTVAVEDQFGNILARYATGTVVLDLKPGTGPANALVCNNPVAVRSGKARFTCQFHQYGTGFVLRATSTPRLNNGFSGPVNVLR